MTTTIESEGLRAERLEDGRFYHKVRQSGLSTFDICGERARSELAGEVGDTTSDAAAIGTGCHTAIETCLHEHHEGAALSRRDTLGVFQDAFSDLMQEPAFRWVKYSEDSARAFGETCVTHWYNDVLPTMPDSAELEWGFLVPLHEDEQRVIELSGTIDYLRPEIVRDWKTAGGGPYQEWQYRRWAVQPTVYSYAAAALGMLDPFKRGRHRDTELFYEFEYVVLSKKGVQRFTVERTDRDWAWLVDKAIAMATLIEAELPVWPKNDTHTLCSAKWCGNFENCKGSKVGANPSNW